MCWIFDDGRRATVGDLSHGLGQEQSLARVGFGAVKSSRMAASTVRRASQRRQLAAATTPPTATMDKPKTRGSQCMALMPGSSTA